MDFLKQKGPLAREFCNTLIYIISLVSLKPSSLQRVLTELQWNGMWFFSLAFFAVIFMEMLSDFLLVTDRCTASALGSYEKEDYKEINHGNLITLADFYGVSVDYLLCRTENREQINTPLTELHLNDEMVALLKSGRINNRLLCELATHKDFIKFLADIEIYVDGIATMQIQNLNTLVDTVRHEIIERYRPGEDDPHLKVLQAAHISDDEYFSHMVLDDLNLIIRDIRETHKKDSESAPQTTVANELKENLEAVENFKGSRLEKLAVLYCKQLGINYKNLSDEEFRWLIRILQKSKKTGTPINQRKKR